MIKVRRRHHETCPQRHLVPESTPWKRWGYRLAMIASLAWFFIRVIPKPIRATYPCQQAAFPMASALVLWFLAVKRRGENLAREHLARLQLLLVAIAIVLTASSVIWRLHAAVVFVPTPVPGWQPSEPPNSPMGTAKGIYPGRVVWTHDPLATSWNGVNTATNTYFQDRYTSLSVVETMVSKTIQKLTGTETDAAAWDALFRFHNQSAGRGTNGYIPGEVITLKINCNNSGGDGASWNAIDVSPQMVLALLRQLVNVAGVPQTNIIVYDAQRMVFRAQSYCTNEFPAVQFRGSYPGPISWVNGVVFATNAVPATAGKLPNFVTNATYSINLALLKRHSDVVSMTDTYIPGSSAITCCFKNHFGSISSPGSLHSFIRDWTNGMPSYNALVDVEGNQHLAPKTMLYLIDGLYGGKRMDAVPVKWIMPPFSNRWPASLFGSLDIVAIDSVALDFLRTEWGVMPNADNFLHEAALADNPPSGIYYAPNGDGVRLASLGVHEHWNNPINKQYSRNLSTNGTGIELVPVHSETGIAVALVSPIDNAVFDPSVSVLLRARADSAYTRIQRVDFYSSGALLGSCTNAPFACAWTNPPTGTWSLTAVGIDSQGICVTSAVVRVAIQTTDLAVSITQPTNSSVLTEGVPTVVRANAAPASGGIQQVNFYVDDMLVNTRTESPYAVDWPNPLPGSSTLLAVATGADNLRAASEPVHVTVRPGRIVTAGQMYVDLRATNFSAVAGVWTNWGSLGSFVSIGRPQFDTNVAGTGIPGVRAMWGTNSIMGPNAVDDICGSSDRSVEVWMYNPYYNPYATLVSWAHRGANTGAFAANCSTLASSGAACLGDTNHDVGWGDPTNNPTANAWHHIVYTYDGGTNFNVYVDGTLRVRKIFETPLDTNRGEPILVGGWSRGAGAFADVDAVFPGHINSLRLHGGTLSASDVANNFTVGPSVALVGPLWKLVTLTNSTIMGTFGTIIGHTYSVEYTENLDKPVWMPLGPEQIAMGSTMTISDTLGGSQRFYRVGLKQ